jgi:hypothetical protein
MRVRVYRNLTRRCLSVQRKVPGKGWRLDRHVQWIQLADASFEVSQAGRERVLSTGRKNVHAFVVGTPVEPSGIRNGVGVTYNPRKFSSFVTATGEPVTKAALVAITVGGMTAAL